MPDIPLGGSPRRSRKRAHSSPSTPPRDDSWVVSWLEFGLQLTPAERALIVKGIRPELTAREVASRCGVSVRTLYRLPEFRAVNARNAKQKPATSQYRGRERRRIEPPDDGWGFTNPFDPDV
jgi:hypothetical protein